ncbi:ATP-binding protein [Rhodococcoides fascians A25f]|uniref:AAA family ATPase n=1 Tax=Rhodococcoides fascians TaxID=1828 RepID=UPI0006891EAA|nr:AAA family ATPase [Rhodococcus fascians]QII06953.1 ATP-binding protein [Rhodococcus fascians A25f]
MIHIVTGPPASGKSTFVAEHARPGLDTVIDFDVMADAFGAGGSRVYDQALARMIQASRRAAVDYVLKSEYWRGLAVDAYIVHTSPNAQQRKRYAEVDATIHVIDPGEDVVMQRIAAERPAHLKDVALDYYYPERREIRRAQKKAAEAQQWVYTSEGRRVPLKPRTSRRWG